MMYYIFFALVPLFLAAAFRLRGTYHRNLGTTAGRILFWAIPIDIVCTVIAFVCGWSLWFGTICGVLAWAGACIGHGSAMGDTLEDYEEMSIITAIRLVMLSTAFLVAGHNYLDWNIQLFALAMPLFGFGGGIGYWLGYRMKSAFTIRWLGVSCVPDDTSWGELFTGAFAYGLPLQMIGFIALMGRGA